MAESNTNGRVARFFSDIEQYKKFTKELVNETPRGILLVSTSTLDQVLRDLLFARFDTDEMSRKQRDSLNQSIQNFTSKISLAQALGLIGKEEASSFAKLNDIRNKFAHRWDANFTDDNIVEACNSLPIKFTDQEKKTPVETAFDQFCYIISHHLRDLITRTSQMMETGNISAWSSKIELHRGYIASW